MHIHGLDVSKENDTARVTVGAGEPWDSFVARCVEEGFGGVAALSGIPGTVGATPIQNVGAYGVEVSTLVEEVRAYDRDTGAFVTLPNGACAFGYRRSVFQRTARWIVTSVTFRLARSAACDVRYAEAARALGVALGDRVPAARVRETIVFLRRQKGMVVDPSDRDTQSAGSFFKNPVVDAASWVDLRTRTAKLGKGEPPHFPAGDKIKLAAAYLIEQAGFKKGYGSTSICISPRHALSLVHRGGGTTRELLDLAAEIQGGVERVWGIALEREPVIVGSVG